MKQVPFLTAVASVAFALSASSAHAVAPGSSIAATANATVVESITISEMGQLNFGSFTASNTAGTVTDGGTATGGIAVISSGNPGSFEVNGHDSSPYTVVQDTSVTLSSSGAPNMTADLTDINGSHMLSFGSESLTVHGTLHVAANQPAGAYTGTYNIAVHY